tara:strand:- start:893 stop:1516 length:624 start_codon:yes stop_codon:yes gene_type:complete
VAIISNGTTILDAGSFSVNLGSLTFIKSVTVSGAANATIQHGSSSVVFDSTYPVYLIKYINVFSSTGQNIAVNFSVDGGTSYAGSMVTSAWVAEHSENDSDVARTDYSESYDKVGTDQILFNINKGGLENASDASASGEMYVFNPSSTTFATHFMSRANSLSEYPGSTDNFVAGYVNSTSAVTGIRWHVVSSGTLSGTFLLYGLKDS